MKRKKPMIIFISLLIITIVSITTYYIRPIIYWPEEHIYETLVKDTPIGCNKEFVLEYTKMKGYVFDPNKQGARNDNMGDNYMRVYLGHYQGIPFRCDVTVFWIFDERDKLIHIDVWKDHDAL